MSLELELSDAALLKSEHLVVAAWDRDIGSRHDIIGTCVIHLGGVQLAR